jgi:hypothetical protein
LNNTCQNNEGSLHPFRAGRFALINYTTIPMEPFKK